MNVYLSLTGQFNQGRVRAIISSGQAVVFHRLAIMSKDGDWIIREDEETTCHIPAVLAEHGARYRFGAPLDVRWLAGGWSSHFEFNQDGLRVRTDFVSRPPRISGNRLAEIWREQEYRNPPVVDVPDLALLKMTNREKDFVIIGELARRMPDPARQLRYSRSARDILSLVARNPRIVQEVAQERPVLALAFEGRDMLEEGLDHERRMLIRANEERLSRYLEAAEVWMSRWKHVETLISGLDLVKAHQIVVSEAEERLPFSPEIG